MGDLNLQVDGINNAYRKVASTSLCRLEAHAGFFRLSMKGKFKVYFTVTF